MNGPRHITQMRRIHRATSCELDLFLIKANGVDSLFGPKEVNDTLEESWELIEVRRACSKVLLC